MRRRRRKKMMRRPASPGRSWRRRPCGALATLPGFLGIQGQEADVDEEEEEEEDDEEAGKSWEELAEEALRCAGKLFQCTCVHAAMCELLVGGQRRPGISRKAQASSHFLLRQLLAFWQVAMAARVAHALSCLHVCCSDPAIGTTRGKDHHAQRICAPMPCSCGRAETVGMPVL